MSPFAKIILSVFAVFMAIAMTSAIKAERKKKREKKVVYLLIFAALFTASSLFWTTDIAYDTETITHLEFGWPISFGVQDLSFYNPPFPYPMHADFGGHSGRGVFIGENFIFSSIINFILATAVWWLVVAIISWWRSK